MPAKKKPAKKPPRNRRSLPRKMGPVRLPTIPEDQLTPSSAR